LPEGEAKVNTLLEEVEFYREEVLRLRRQLARMEIGKVMQHVQEVNGVKVLAAQVEASSMETLREMTDWLRDRLGSAVIVLGAVMKGQPGFVAVVTPDLVDKGLRADRLIREVAAVVGGSGGGHATMAQAGGKDPARMGEALSLVSKLLVES